MMNMRTLTYACTLSVVVAIGLTAAACKKNSIPTSPTVTIIRFDAGERVAGQAVNGFVAGIRSIASSAQPPASATQAAPTARLGVALASADCQATSIHYFNASGQEQPAYNPNTTTRATAAGTCVYSSVSTAVSLTVDDMLASATSYLVNGTTVTAYEGMTANGTITNVRIPKQGCAYPLSGDMSVKTDATTFTVHFDGSANAIGTYTVNGQTVIFTIPLSGC